MSLIIKKSYSDDCLVINIIVEGIHMLVAIPSQIKLANAVTTEDIHITTIISAGGLVDSTRDEQKNCLNKAEGSNCKQNSNVYLNYNLECFVDKDRKLTCYLVESGNESLSP